MASADTFPSARKQQELLQAGRSKLVEWKNRRKGTPKTKNTSSSNKNMEPPSSLVANDQLKQPADGSLQETQDASQSVSDSQDGSSVSLSQGEAISSRHGDQRFQVLGYIPLDVNEMVSTADSEPSRVGNTLGPSRPPFTPSLSSTLQPGIFSSSSYSTALSQGSFAEVHENGNPRGVEMSPQASMTSLAETAKRKEQNAEEAKRREGEAEEVRRKEHEAEEAKRRDHEEARRKQQAEFAGLEQHIQDLTEEKFALQRSLDKARAMTEELASENSALILDFNNQGQVVNQLREDIDRLEGRRREQEAYAESLMSERDRAQQESASALDRSQSMAGEVIVLENRIRILRCHELKMEKNMSTLTSEVESHKKHVASWEKDRTHLESLIDALQEEKKLLQVRLRELASGERDISRTSENSEAAEPREQSLADASTSTEGLLVEPVPTASEGPSTPLDSPSLDSWQHGRQFEEQHSSHSIAQRMPLRSSVQSSQLPALSSYRSSLPGPSFSSGMTIDSPQSGGYGTIHPPASFSSIPVDLVRTINNINDVVTSLGDERTALVKALKAESRGAAELRALNTDLTRKLEATTQQLELVVAQRMAQGSSSAENAIPRSTRMALDYVNEEDEVVDHVVIWINAAVPLWRLFGVPLNSVKRL